MNWRTAWIPGIIVWLCYMNEMSLTDTIIVTSIATLICIFALWAFKVFAWEWWVERQRANILALRFMTNDDEHSWPEIIPVGESKHTISVRFKFGIDLRDIGLRFLSYEEAERTLGTGKPDDISHRIAITGMPIPSFLEPRSKISDGGRGGARL